MSRPRPRPLPTDPDLSSPFVMGARTSCLTIRLSIYILYIFGDRGARERMSEGRKTFFSYLSLSRLLSPAAHAWLLATPSKGRSYSHANSRGRKSCLVQRAPGLSTWLACERQTFFLAHRLDATNLSSLPPQGFRPEGEIPRRLACVSSVSVWFRSKERPRNGILGEATRRHSSNWRVY